MKAIKGNWQKMLKNEVPNMDLISERNKVFDWLPTEVKDYFPKKMNMGFECIYVDENER